MNLYRSLHAKLPPSVTDVANRGTSLGGNVMLLAAHNNWTVPTHMTQITNAFYNALVTFGWRWTPTRSCGDYAVGAKMLDGEMTNAECQVPAMAFELLLTLPAPHGFGAVAKKVTYAAKEEMIGVDNAKPTALNVKRAPKETAFYSHHPIGGIHHLPPNVWSQEPGHITGIYRWIDHKVVEVNGRYWDVCYNTSYAYLQDMAIALLVGINEQTGPTKNIQEAMARISEDKVMIKNWFQIAYFRSPTYGGAAQQADARVVGPYYDSLYGDEATLGANTPTIQW